MKKWITISLVALVLAGCGTSNSAGPSSTVNPASPIVSVIKARVDTQQLVFAPTWIPVQLNPEFRENHSITRQNEWPTHGTDVYVRCWVDGGEYMNPITNSLQYEWYKIDVPADKVDPAILPAGGNESGYVETFWLDLHGGNSNVRECVQ